MHFGPSPRQHTSLPTNVVMRCCCTPRVRLCSAYCGLGLATFAIANVRAAGSAEGGTKLCGLIYTISKGWMTNSPPRQPPALSSTQPCAAAQAYWLYARHRHCCRYQRLAGGMVHLIQLLLKVRQLLLLLLLQVQGLLLIPPGGQKPGMALPTSLLCRCVWQRAGRGGGRAHARRTEHRAVHLRHKHNRKTHTD